MSDIGGYTIVIEPPYDKSIEEAMEFADEARWDSWREERDCLVDIEPDIARYRIIEEVEFYSDRDDETGELKEDFTYPELIHMWGFGVTRDQMKVFDDIETGLKACVVDALRYGVASDQGTGGTNLETLHKLYPELIHFTNPEQKDIL